jgi:hypothetical protein
MRYFGASQVLVVLQVGGAPNAHAERAAPQLACFPNGVVNEPICGEDLMGVAPCCVHRVRGYPHTTSGRMGVAWRLDRWGDPLAGRRRGPRSWRTRY